MMDIDYLPPGKECCVCMSIDDVFPGRSTDHYEGGGDLDKGALKYVKWLLARHKKLKITLFTTANWREINSSPTRRVLASIPFIRDRAYLARRYPKDTMRLDRHPGFVSFLNSLERAEIGYHGLYHCHRGPRIPVEFQDEGYEQILSDLKEMESIFDKAGLKAFKGLCPPGWNAPPPLIKALRNRGFKYVASARDLFTPIGPDARTDISGLKGMSLIYPQLIDGDLVHFSTNFQATSEYERAREILDLGGLLKIKGHMVKLAFGEMSLDGLDQVYANYLDLLFRRIEEEFGKKVWWASMGEVSKRILDRH